MILYNVLILSVIAVLAAVVLFLVSKKFAVKEDEKAVAVAEILPQANCGACGCAGCADFALRCAKASAAEFKDLYCPVGGAEVMQRIASVLGYDGNAKERQVAVLKCNGSCQNAPAKVDFEGMKSCQITNRFSVGLSGCPNGCLRFGDCVKACPFGALHIDETSGLPVVDEDLCTGCGVCVKICPRRLYELRNAGDKVFVACSNTQKGAQASKNCAVSCIGCQKCAKLCPQVAVENNLAYIPQTVSVEKYGKELAEICPRGAILLKKEKND